MAGRISKYRSRENAGPITRTEIETTDEAAHLRERRTATGALPSAGIQNEPVSAVLAMPKPPRILMRERCGHETQPRLCRRGKDQPLHRIAKPLRIFTKPLHV